LKTVTESQFFILNPERLLVCPVRIEVFNKAGLAKKEIKVINPLELVFQFFKSVDGEIGGDYREAGVVFDAFH